MKQPITVKCSENPKEYFRQYGQLNRDRKRKQSHLWQLNNPEKRKLIQERYERSHGEQRRESGKAYYENNRDKCLASSNRRLNTPEGKAKRLEYLRKYKKQAHIASKLKLKRTSPEGRAYNRIYQHGRRATERNQSNTNDVNQLKRLYEIVKNKLWVRCYYCGKKIRGDESHIDHIIAISKNGPHRADNICVACASCNLSKNNKHPNEWMGNKQLILL